MHSVYSPSSHCGRSTIVGPLILSVCCNSPDQLTPSGAAVGYQWQQVARMAGPGGKRTSLCYRVDGSGYETMMDWCNAVTVNCDG